MLAKFFPLLLKQRSQFVIHIIEQWQDRREFMFLAIMQSLSYDFSGNSSFLSLIWDIFWCYILHKFSESFDGIILLPPLFSLIIGSVKRWIIWGWMITHSVGHELYKIRFFLLDDIISSKLSCFEHGQGIVSIDSCARYSEWNCSGNDSVSCILILNWGWDGILIVSEQEQGLAFKSGCKIESSREVSFTGCTLSQIACCYFLLISSSEGISWASSLRNLCGWIVWYILSGEETVTLLHCLLP